MVVYGTFVVVILKVKMNVYAVYLIIFLCMFGVYLLLYDLCIILHIVIYTRNTSTYNDKQVCMSRVYIVYIMCIDIIYM